LGSLSVIIITKNEEANLGDCLSSVGFADEVIVVDNNSIDSTVTIAKSHGAKVFLVNEWPGFGAQKNYALSLATGDWVLSIDADERVSEELGREIGAVVREHETTLDCYELARVSWFCGKRMKFSGWSPDPVRRLFRRGAAHFSDHAVHEHLICKLRVGRLNGNLLHFPFDSLEQVIRKMDHYSSVSATTDRVRVARASLAQAIVRGLFAFARTYFFRLGFLDGSHGLALAIANGEGVYYKYAKAWLLEKRQQGGSF